MRTLGHCQDRGLDLYVGCACGERHMNPAADECRAVRGWTIEELHRAGWFACRACGSAQAAVSVYRDGIGYRRQLENWRSDGAITPAPIDHQG
jgi:hypothetical protein